MGQSSLIRDGNRPADLVGVVDIEARHGRPAHAEQTAMIDIVTIMLGVAVDANARTSNFLTFQPIGIFVMGIVTFVIATPCGVLLAKLMS